MPCKGSDRPRASRIVILRECVLPSSARLTTFRAFWRAAQDAATHLMPYATCGVMPPQPTCLVAPPPRLAHSSLHLLNLTARSLAACTATRRRPPLRAEKSTPNARVCRTTCTPRRHAGRRERAELEVLLDLRRHRRDVRAQLVRHAGGSRREQLLAAVVWLKPRWPQAPTAPLATRRPRCRPPLETPSRPQRRPARRRRYDCHSRTPLLTPVLLKLRSSYFF